MPPPKRPKLGPISIEQFLSQDELQELEEDGSQRKGHDALSAISKGPLNLTTHRRTSRKPTNRLRDLFCEDHDSPMTVSSWNLDSCRNNEDSPCSSCILLRNSNRVIYNQASTDVSLHLSHSSQSISSYQAFDSEEPSDLSLKEPKRERSSSSSSDIQERPARNVTPTGELLGNSFTRKKESVRQGFRAPDLQSRSLLTTVNPGKSIFSGGLPSTFTRSDSVPPFYAETTTTSQVFISPRISSTSKATADQTELTENQDSVRDKQLRLLAATLTNRKKFLNKNQKNPWSSGWPSTQTSTARTGNLPMNDMTEELSQSYAPSAATVSSGVHQGNIAGGEDYVTEASDLGVASSSDAMPSADNDGQEEQRKCQICNDLASGFHYGVWSCEGCKAFFKRSLQGPVDYMCPATNSCTIDKHRRKSCQACRFRKCLEVGMMKRRERRSTKKTKLSSNPEEKVPNKKVKTLPPPLENSELVNGDMNTHSTHIETSDAALGQVTAQSGAAQLPSPPDEVLSPVIQSSPPPSSFLLTPSPSSTGSSSHQMDPFTFFNRDLGLPFDQPHPLVVSLEQNNLPNKVLGQKLTDSETEYTLMHKLITLADMELVDIVNWAKMLPGFSQLELNDRIALLESCWMELLCIGAAWRSRVNDTFQINFADDLHFNEDLARLAKLSPIVGEIWQISRQFMYFELTFHEFLLLRVITLLNSESVRLSSMDAMYSLRGKYLEALHFECGRHLGKISETSCVRMAQILCILPFARQVSMKAITHMFNLHSQHSVPVGELVAEMLVAHKELNVNMDDHVASPTSTEPRI